MLRNRKKALKPLSKILCLSFILLYNAAAFSQKNQLIQQEVLQKKIEKGELLANDITDWSIVSETTSKTSGVKHIYYIQQLNGIPIIGTEASVHISKQGKLVSSTNNFIKDITSKLSKNNTISKVTPLKALDVSLHSLGMPSLKSKATLLKSKNKTLNAFNIKAENISNSNIPVKLTYVFSKQDQKLHLVWNLRITPKDTDNLWKISVDAITGKLLNKEDIVLHCGVTAHNHSIHTEKSNVKHKHTSKYKSNNYATNTALAPQSYEVFALPLESPHNGSGNRSIVANPTAGTVAGSPFGWHDTNGISGNEYTITRGNNVFAFEYDDNKNYSPDGGATLDFTTTNSTVDFSFTSTYTTNVQSEAAAITNVFYIINATHDIYFEYGFDEEAGNFQETNYSGKGLGNDYLEVEVQHERGCNAAGFRPTLDGETPSIRIGVCQERDGAYDNIVLTHEYTHGLTKRLTGGPLTDCITNKEGSGMGEGWSDWYALMLTQEGADKPEAPRTIATWFRGQSPTGSGVRTVPYTTDMSLNPQTYDNLDSVQLPHGAGTIWASMLWEVTWALIDKHGFNSDLYKFTGNVNQDAGNIQALAIVTEALKLQPCSPGFVDARDAILQADSAIYGGANLCEIWNAFAKRGLGFSAVQGDPDNVFDGREAFDVPVVNIETVPEVCISSGVQNYGNAFPEGGVFSGPGVTDNGDGKTYTFNPDTAGIGTHTITYTNVTSSLCGTSNAATSTIEVTNDTPELVCSNVSVTLDDTGNATIDYTDVISNLLPAVYDVDQTGTFAPIDIDATGTVIPLGNSELSTALPIGFNFNFFGINYTEFYISNDGFITFDPDIVIPTGEADEIPKADGTNNLIAALWGNMTPRSTTMIRYEVIGTSPNKKLIVEFENIRFRVPGGVADTQIHLFEGSSKIEIHSTRLSTPRRTVATQGIENADGTQAVFVNGRVETEIEAENDYVSFTLGNLRIKDNCGNKVTASLSKTNFTTSDLGNNNITVTLTDENSRTADCDLTVTVLPNGTLSTNNDETIANDVKLFPNPVENNLNVSYTGQSPLEKITIYDLYGRKVKDIIIDDITTTSRLSIPMNNFYSGVYLIAFKTIHQQSFVKQIVKK